MDREALAKIIWKKPLSEVTEAEAAALVHQYPFFSGARFLHLEKLDSNSAAYAESYQKAILYYHTPTAFATFLNAPKEIILHAESAAATGKAPESAVVENIEKDNLGSDLKIAPLKTELNSKDETSLVFEPFHTVDYFASQGIKPAADETPNDKFGKQLKSFTDWLKTMKKIPAAETTKDAVVENVESLAAHSVEDAPVITESMAEVWLKQGNGEKAIDTYRKLSLQNPAKSAYFAAKIQSIKEQK